MKTLKFAVLVVLVLLVFGMNQSANAGFHHFWGGPVWGPRAFAYPYYGYGYYGYAGYYGYGWADACCAPVAEPCCAPAVAPVAAPVECATCAPVCDTCGPVVGYPASYVLGWRPGPIRRLLFGRYRWYATSYWGGYYYTPDCCAPVYDAVETAPVQTAPAPATPATTPAAPNSSELPSVEQPQGDTSILSNNVFHQASFTQKEATMENSGIVTISVPEDAVVFVNDVRTTAKGSNRSFVSFGLQSGNEYDYVIRAEVTRDGKTYVETKVVTLTAGQKDAVSFAFPQITNPVEQVVSM